MANKHIEISEHHQSSGNANKKHNKIPLDWFKWKRLTIPSASGDIMKPEL